MGVGVGVGVGVRVGSGCGPPEPDGLTDAEPLGGGGGGGGGPEEPGPTTAEPLPQLVSENWLISEPKKLAMTRMIATARMRKTTPVRDIRMMLLAPSACCSSPAEVM